MRKSGSIVVMVALLLVATFAATAEARPRLGFNAGLAIADQTWEYSNVLGTVNRNHSIGMAAGLFVELPIIPILQLRPEALYVQKGSRIEVAHLTYAGVPSGTTTYKDRIDYLSLGATARL